MTIMQLNPADAEIILAVCNLLIVLLLDSLYKSSSWESGFIVKQVVFVIKAL